RLRSLARLLAALVGLRGRVRSVLHRAVEDRERVGGGLELRLAGRRGRGLGALGNDLGVGDRLFHVLHARPPLGPGNEWPPGTGYWHHLVTAADLVDRLAALHP